MGNVLIVDDSPDLLKSLKEAVDSFEHQVNILVAANGDEAVRTLKNIPISVLITDLSTPQIDGLDLLSYMSRCHPETPCILVAPFTSKEIRDVVANLGVYRFLGKPFELSSLISSINDAIKQVKIRKPLGRLSLPEFLKLLVLQRRTCRLDIVNKYGMKGSFSMIEGIMYDARCGNLKGEEAALSIMGWDKVSFNLNDLPTRNIEKNIQGDVHGLIRQASISVTESEDKIVVANTQPPAFDQTDRDEILFEAIRSAEVGNTVLAQRALSILLKSNPNESKGWLWFARTAANLKDINIALNNASISTPTDPEVPREIRKVKSAVRSGCSESSPLVHCPFCWAPVVKEQVVCHFCNAYLDIHEDLFHTLFFSAHKEPDLKILLESFQRFTKNTILEPRSVKAHFFLAMAHINLDQWDEALEELKKIQSLAPDNNPYQMQLEILADFMDDLGTFFSRNSRKDETLGHPGEISDKGKSIMVVEDSATTRNVIRKMLIQDGYDVVEAGDGLEALAICNEHKPDLILLDIIMPGLDGYQTLAALKKNHDFDGIPVIMLTAKDSLIDKLKGKMSGTTEYLTKPFKSSELIKVIRSHLE